jgi:hypothetical protein
MKYNLFFYLMTLTGEEEGDEQKHWKTSRNTKKKARK